MKRELKYVELKTGYSDDGPAWIGYVEYSKSKKTVYFNGKAFSGNGHGHCIDLETNETYWITGVKKNSSNRHNFGRGIVQIDKDAVDEYESTTGIIIRGNKHFKTVVTKTIDKLRFEKLLNEKL